MIKDTLNGIVVRCDLGEHVAESIRAHFPNIKLKASQFGVIEIDMDFKIFLLNISNINSSQKWWRSFVSEEVGGGTNPFLLQFLIPLVLSLMGYLRTLLLALAIC